jgi:hypothetical protein
MAYIKYKHKTAKLTYRCENIHAHNDIPLHDLKFGVWSALSACKIIMPVFF